MNGNPLCESPNPLDMLVNASAVCAFVQVGAFERDRTALPLSTEAQYGAYLVLETCKQAIHHAVDVFEAQNVQG